MFFRVQGLKAIYTMHAIQSFALSLISVFIPIYLLTLGYSLQQVLLFFIVYYAVVGVGAFVAIWLSKIFGLITTINFRFPLLVLFLLSLLLLKIYNLPIYLIALIGGLQNILYWIPLHLLFTRHSKEKKLGSATGWLFALPKIVSLLAPLIGGFLAVMFGFNFLFLISIVILLISTLPLVGIEQIDVKFDFKARQGWKMFKKHPKYFIAELFENLGEETQAIIWPIFIYLNLMNIAVVGAISTMSKIGAILFTLIIGKTADRFNKKKLFKIGAVLLAITWLLRYFFVTEAMFYLTTLLIGFFMLMLLVPYTAVLYKIAKKETTDEFFVFREIPVAISRIAI